MKSLPKTKFVCLLLFISLLFAIQVSSFADWTENFESYDKYVWPNTWTPDANATDITGNYVDRVVFYEGDKSLKLTGKLGACWGALAYKPLATNPPFEIEIMVRNGDKQLSGCHPDRAYIGLRQGTSWSNPGRGLLHFMGDGTIKSGSQTITLDTYNTNEWYKIKIRYELDDNAQVKLNYWINDTWKTEEILPVIAAESLLDNIDLTVQEGSGWFDNLEITQVDPVINQNSVTINSLSPESPATLPIGGSVYINFNYTSLNPNIRIFARPFYNGSRAQGYNASGSPIYSEQSGTIVSRFGFESEAEVDSIRFQFVDSTAQQNLLYETFLPVDFSFIDTTNLKTTEPNVWILDNNDTDYSNAPFEDKLSIISTETSEILFEIPQFNICQTIGAKRLISADPNGNLWIASNVHDSTYIVNSLGEIINRIPIAGNAIEISSDGKIFQLASSGTIYGSSIRELSNDGLIINEKNYGGFDFVLDEINKNIWIVGADIKVLDYNLNLLMSVDPIAWCAVSVDIDNDGNAWVAEREHSQVVNSINRIFKINKSGIILDSININISPSCIRFNQHTNEVIIAAGYLKKYSISEKTYSDFTPHSSFSIDIDYENQIIWGSGSYNNDVLKGFDYYGNELYSYEVGSDQKYVVTKPFKNEKILSANFTIGDSTTNEGTIPFTIQFIDQSTGSPATWLWNFGDGFTSTAPYPIHTYDSVGIYTVSLTVTNDNVSDTETKTDYITVRSPITCYSSLNAPILSFEGTEDYETSSGAFTRYMLNVDNYEQFPAELFTTAPHLSPCSSNENAARSWVNIFKQDSVYLYGFCALSASEQLDDIWFGIEQGQTPPEAVYITITDRECGITYSSNKVEFILPDECSYTATIQEGKSFDFSDEVMNASVTDGDLYYLNDGTLKFWANNVGQQGCLDLGNIGQIALSDVEIPTSGYSRHGVTAVLGNTYVSLAQEGEDNHYIIFRITSISDTTVEVDYSYQYMNKATLDNGNSFDFSEGVISGNYTGGDLYYSAINMEFYANNIGQRGLLSLGDIGNVPLNQVPIPESGYSRFGAEIIECNTYVSLAQEGEEGNYIVFRVLSTNNNTVKLSYLYRNLNKTEEDYIIKYTSTPPQIDGIIDPIDETWGDFSEIGLTRSSSTTFNLNAKFQILADDDSLYFAFIVTDNTPHVEDELAVYEKDNCGIYLSMNSEPTANGAYTEGDWWFKKQRIGGTLTATSGGANDINQALVNATNVATISNTSGYVQEWSIPFSALTTGMINPWDKEYLRFDIECDDNTSGMSSGRTQQKFWKNTSDVQWMDTRDFCRAILEKKPVVPCTVDPEWQVVSYTNNTTAYCIVTIDGEPATVNDKVGAFVGDECRGIADITIYKNEAYATMLIQGEAIETVSFKVWDASECTEFDAYYSTQTNPGANIGYPPNFLPVNVCFDVSQQVALNAGWKLVSFFADDEGQTMDKLFGTSNANILQVKSMVHSWDPTVPTFLNTLTSLHNRNVPGFFVKASNAGTVEITGAYIGDEHNSPSLSQGWNLIGYPFDNGQVITTAFNQLISNSQLVQIKNMTQSYDPAVPAFLNTLSTIEPGMGYFLKTNTAVSDFFYPTPTTAQQILYADHSISLKSAAPSTRALTAAAQPGWSLVTYTNSTTAYGVATIDDLPAAAEDWVGAFVGDECRAMQQVVINSGIAYITLLIQGETAETISFKVWDSSANKELEVSYTVQSSPGNSIGIYPNCLPIAASSISTDLQVSNTTLSNAEMDCFNAYNTVTVAGDGTTVVLSSGSSANFIAGQSIRFLPGFHAQAGSYVDAHITTNGTFCDQLPQTIVAVNPIMEKSNPLAEDEFNLDGRIEPILKVYPNPNNGRFTVSLENFSNGVKIMIYNSVGALIHQESTFNNKLAVDLPETKRGIYFLKAFDGLEQYNQKIIIQ